MSLVIHQAAVMVIDPELEESLFVENTQPVDNMHILGI
jgi:hypothetical protein